MQIGVIGGGINGLCCAWLLAQDGHQVTLFERDRVMQATSRASSKLLHGGVRYLEHGQFRLVREALLERKAWLAIAPELTSILPIIYPKYREGKRSRWMLGLGFGLYKYMAETSTLPLSCWIDRAGVLNNVPGLRSGGLDGGFLYHDVQMDDYRLGLWVAAQCREAGVTIYEHVEVGSVSCNGTMRLSDGDEKIFDRLLNVAGPWAEHLLLKSNIIPTYRLDLVRGSHLIIDRPCTSALILEVPTDRRIFFVLPWKGKMLIGTTEVRQLLGANPVCSDEETHYLLNAYNHYITPKITEIDIVDTFAGLRPLLRSDANPSRASREYAIQKDQNLLTVYGGKWTTARSLARKVKECI